ncbi:MAG: ribosome maturation factor RimP [Proteobacteria bacterium]|nr:MAG: ribosome maturation factor RimP [Pseudomonadota bacterium]
MKQKQLTTIIQPVITDLGFDLWGIEYMPQKSGALVRIYIDHEQGITVDNCADCSREISAVLEVEDPIKSAYVLEVSSPGLDRVLFDEKQFSLYIGEQAKVKLTQPVNGSRKITGTIKSVIDDEITLVNETDEYTFIINNVMKARLQPQYDGVQK